MAKIKEIEVTDQLTGITTTSVIIENSDGSYTSMLKSAWEEFEAQKELGGTL